MVPEAVVVIGLTVPVLLRRTVMVVVKRLVLEPDLAVVITLAAELVVVANPAVVSTGNLPSFITIPIANIFHSGEEGHSKVDCTQPAKPRSCFNCGEDG